MYEVTIDQQFGDYIALLTVKGEHTFEGSGETLADALRDLACELEKDTECTK